MSTPQLQPESQFRTPSDLDMRHAQAAQRFVRAGELDRIYVSTWQEMGFLALEAERNEDWRLLGYTSPGLWLQTAFKRSRSVVYAAWGAVKELSDIPSEDLASIEHSTAHVLKKVPQSIREADPVLIQDAKNMTTDEFTAEVARKYPELHIEVRVRKAWKFEESQLDKIKEAIALAKLFNIEISRDEDALEHICADYLLSNQQAFENSEGKRRG